MERSDSFLRQLSSKEGWKSASKRWGGGGGGGWKQVEGMYGEMMMKKRVMVVVDQSSHSKHAMMWALTHVTNKADILTLLHIVSSSSHSASSSHLASSLAALCNACKPQVEVEALAIQGPKMETVMSQVKKLEVSVLVLGQKHPSPFLNCLFVRSSADEFVEKCINNLECLTIGVKKQSNGVSGYLISTRWHKNFWLLA
uniref:Universal stress protein 17 n=1 Tax=Salvia miltiorrhiza TaxID=226208 RepID=A0A290YXT2_SALMI|nr:universal stress protein 17 [Salvia miltiorrhiza]